MKKVTLPAAALLAFASPADTGGVAVPEFKPLYSLRIDARNVAYELRVNDIPVLTKDNDASSLTSKFLINPWLVGGRNTLTIRLLPVEKSTTDPQDPKYCRVVITGPAVNGGPDTTLGRVEVSPAKAAGTAPARAKDESFNVILGYPAPAWAASEKIGKDAATQKRILERYREFHRLLENKDLDGVMRFSAAKLDEFARSMYDTTFVSLRRQSFQEQFASPGKLIGIDVQAKDGLRYEYYFGDRLVSIRNVEDRSIIQYYDDDEGVTTEYPLFFYFDGKDFVLIR